MSSLHSQKRHSIAACSPARTQKSSSPKSRRVSTIRHVTVEEISSKPDDPQASTTDTNLYRAIEAAIKKENPGATVLPTIVPYGTDGQKFRVRGVPAYGLIPMIIDLPTLATMHSDSEHIPLDQFRHGVHIYFDILQSEF